MTERQRIDHLDTDQAGTLAHGDEFRYQPDGFGTTWQVYTFLGHVIAPAGEWVECFGGDPIDANNKHHRAHRSFPVADVRKEARPPGAMASGRRRRAA